MKQKLIFRLIVGALAGAAATASYAGQIQASSVSIAREVITTDDQPVTSPTIAYRFFGDVDARLQTQVFQVQFTLGGPATWASTGIEANIKMSDGVTGAAVPVGTALGEYQVTALALSPDKKTLYATITVYSDGTSGAAGLIKQPILSVASSSTSTENPTIQNLKQVVGSIAECDDVVKTLPVSVKHYVALSSPGGLANDANATPDEHKRVSSTNETTLITFPTNILVKVAQSSGDAKLDVTNNAYSFAGANGSSYVSASLVNLGNFWLEQNAPGYDANLLDPYLLKGNAGSTGVKGIATATVGTGSPLGAAGLVEVRNVTAKVSASKGFVVGGHLFLATDALCASPIAGTDVTIGTSNASGPITMTIPTNQVNPSFGPNGTNPVHICYNVAGVTSPIPGSTFNLDAATVVKANAGQFLNEQNNYCKGPLYPLSGSIKIDVRNYASNARKDGWLSVIRLINNSENDTVDVYGQYIQRDGKYGKWGKLATLAPRAVLQMLPQDVDGKLTNAPASPYAGENATSDVATEGDAPRLRITSENASTLRVQNYLYNPASQNFIEASGSQGVDFTYDTSRASSGDTTLEQDAQKGLNHGN